MLVQDRLSPKSHKKKLAKFHSSDHKTLDFPTWVSENLYKIVAIGILIATVAAVYFIRNVVDSSALFRFETDSKSMDKIEIPQIEWNLIASITDKSTPFTNFRSEKWIVVSVSDYPNESIKNLAKIKGWQVLAIGNSRTPHGWSLKGTIFLSLDQQAKLGFRVVDYMPYDSYVRKSVGYLFAIQHGATKIFDADDRSEVIENNISKHFDVELIGEGSKQKILLQYSRENRNRTVVNPYIHFGQRSVWPRGLPLENVGEIGHEEYYGEVFSGKQYIQQGISNGLPDVDSVFYLTRKPVLESFDIMFDEHARKVALPQGIMVPLNSFNTLYHSPAFWGLMLPVSVSTMASDVLRGYWSQRVLWEIGGYVVVYPPTLHRYDRVESYPFAEEKDIHVNVGRMIAFLVSWRSNKHSSLFEKILELSYVLAKEGFWSERDLKFTAAWLQDLIAVGYKQPRLVSSPELENPTVYNIGVHGGNKKDFVPRKLPSVHLGVEETETVNYEIGNLIRWRRSFGNVVLIMYCNGQVERTALEWRLLYGRIFKTVVILSKEENVDLAVEEGKVDQLYKNLPNIYNRFPNAEGFLFLDDNTVLNYWNLMQADKTRLWITDKVSKSWTTVSLKGNNGWFTKQAEMINEVVSKMPVHFQVSYKESTASDHSLRICNTEVFYLPRRFVADFNDLVDLVGDLEIHQKVAIPAFFMAMDSPQNFDPILSTMIYKRKPPTNSSTFYSAEVPAIRPWTVSSEQDFIKLIRLMAAGDPLLMELV